MTANIFQGCIPALMTPCDAAGTPDFPALVRKAEELINHGMSAVVYCGSMGDWPLLTDARRRAGVEHLVKAGLPVIVGTGAQNTNLAAEHAAHARQVGAKGLMVIPRVLSRGTSPAAQRAGSLLAPWSPLPTKNARTRISPTAMSSPNSESSRDPHTEWRDSNKISIRANPGSEPY